MDMDPEFILVGEVGLLVQREVAGGFASRRQIIQLAVEVFEGQDSESGLRALAEEMAASSFYQQRKAQKSWPLVTDCDRLDIASPSLRRRTSSPATTSTATWRTRSTSRTSSTRWTR